MINKGAITKESIEALKQHVDIVSVISRFIPLKKSGANYTCNCPFHDEQTPSFTVSPSKGFFHCFGCHKSGDSITFIKEYRKIGYREAVEELADMVGFSLKYQQGYEKLEANTYEYLGKIANFYHENLLKQTPIIKYLQDRGLSLELIKEFKLGFAKNLINFLNDYKIPFSKIEEMGLIARDNNQNYYERFYKRIIFPIVNQQNKILGFGGRILGKEGIKYINSPNNIIFNKSRVFYGLNFAMDHIRKSGKIIIVEGYFDVILMQSAGFKNTVATLGTALGAFHVSILTRLVDKVILCFDSDGAGVEAAFKASHLLKHIEGGVALLGKGGINEGDPADLIHAGKIEYIKECIENYLPFSQFIIDHLLSKYNLDNPLQKNKAYKESQEFLKTLDFFSRNYYIKYIANKFNVKIPNKPNNNYKNNNEISNNEILEIRIIRTILENPNVFMPHLTLKTHRFKFKEKTIKLIKELIKKNNLKDEYFTEIFASNYEPLELDEFKSVQQNLQKIRIEEEKKMIGMENTSYEERQKKIDLLNEELKSLNKFTHES